jgi:hypothetical protein
MKRSPISQALIEAQKAFDKASQALPEYAPMQTAKAAYAKRQTSLDEAQRLLRFILKWEPSAAAEDLARFRKAATIRSYDELGHDKVQELIAAMKAIESRHLAAKRAAAERLDAYWRDRERATGRMQDFTDDERRFILSTLHPDANASPGRRGRVQGVQRQAGTSNPAMRRVRR